MDARWRRSTCQVVPYTTHLSGCVIDRINSYIEINGRHGRGLLKSMVGPELLRALKALSTGTALGVVVAL